MRPGQNVIPVLALTTVLFALGMLLPAGAGQTTSPAATATLTPSTSASPSPTTTTVRWTHGPHWHLASVPMTVVILEPFDHWHRLATFCDSPGFEGEISKEEGDKNETKAGVRFCTHDSPAHQGYVEHSHVRTFHAAVISLHYDGHVRWDAHHGHERCQHGQTNGTVTTP